MTAALVPSGRVPTENSGGTVGNLRPFGPGVSGNPGGRPKGLAALIREQTRDGAELVEFMLRVSRSKRFALRYRMEATAWLADRGFGKALQQLEVGGAPGEPLTIRIEYAADADPDRDPA